MRERLKKPPELFEVLQKETYMQEINTVCVLTDSLMPVKSVI